MPLSCRQSWEEVWNNRPEETPPAAFVSTKPDDTAHPKLDNRLILLNPQQRRDQTTEIRKVSYHHHVLGFCLQLVQHGSDVIIRPHGRDLLRSVLGLEPRCQDLGSLARSQFLAVLDAVKSHSERGQTLRHVFNGTSALVGQAPLRVFGLAFGCSMLD
jgi:hypothetical protein